MSKWKNNYPESFQNILKSVMLLTKMDMPPALSTMVFPNGNQGISGFYEFSLSPTGKIEQLIADLK